MLKNNKSRFYNWIPACSSENTYQEDARINDFDFSKKAFKIRVPDSEIIQNDAHDYLDHSHADYKLSAHEDQYISTIQSSLKTDIGSSGLMRRRRKEHIYHDVSSLNLSANKQQVISVDKSKIQCFEKRKIGEYNGHDIIMRSINYDSVMERSSVKNLLDDSLPVRYPDKFYDSLFEKNVRVYCNDGRNVKNYRGLLSYRGYSLQSIGILENSKKLLKHTSSSKLCGDLRIGVVAILEIKNKQKMSNKMTKNLVEDGILVGCLTLRIDSSFHGPQNNTNSAKFNASAYLMTLAVDKNVRSMGIGYSLLQACYDILGDKLKLDVHRTLTLSIDVEKIVLDVQLINKQAISLYKKLGFKQCGKINRGYYSGLKSMSKQNIKTSTSELHHLLRPEDGLRMCIGKCSMH